MVKFNNSNKTLVTEYPFAEDLRLWWFNIEKEEEKVSISDIDGLKFEIVNEFPKGYIVWDINTTSDYLPLCEVDKNKNVNTATLKCIKLESNADVQTVLSAVRRTKVLKRRTLEAMKKFYNKYNRCWGSVATLYKVNNIRNALEAFEKVGIE